MKASVPCPACLTLYLETVGRRRAGGFREAVLRAKIGIFDVVEAELAPGRFEAEWVDEIGGADAGSAEAPVLDAAAGFRREFGDGLGARFLIRKRVPPRAGLGGRASLAAGTLGALSRLHHLETDRGAMARLRAAARKLDPEAVFFLSKDGLCARDGSRSRPWTGTPGRALPWVLVAFPGIEVSPDEVHSRHFPPSRDPSLTGLPHLDNLKNRLENGSPISEWGGLLFNRLEGAVLGLHAEVRQAKRVLERVGLRSVLVSGTGAAVFGFAESREEGERVVERLRGYPWKLFLTSCFG